MWVGPVICLNPELNCSHLWGYPHWLGYLHWLGYPPLVGLPPLVRLPALAGLPPLVGLSPMVGLPALVGLPPLVGLPSLVGLSPLVKLSPMVGLPPLVGLHYNFTLIWASIHRHQQHDPSKFPVQLWRAWSSISLQGTKQSQTQQLPSANRTLVQTLSWAWRANCYQKQLEKTVKIYQTTVPKERNGNQAVLWSPPKG